MTTEIQEISAVDKPNTAGFVKGYDPRRNVSGRPRKTFTDIVTDFPEVRKVNVVEAQFQRAESGDTRAAEFLRDTQDGRPTQRMEVTDTSVADALRAEVLAALAAAGAITVIEGEYSEVTENPS
jgi:hypothetical protein